MNRNQFLFFGLLAFAAPGNLLGASKRNKSKCFVLVHGAWHGGWCWKKVTPLLQANGYSVYTPTLTGLGDRSHLLHPDVTLDTHINDIVSFIEFEDLKNVILVGHSYAGMVITGVAERISSRLSSLVYLDAFLPENGKAVVDYVPPAPQEQSPVEPWRVKPITDAAGFGVSDAHDAEWVNKRLCDQPLRTLIQPVKTTLQDKDIRRVFVQFTQTPWFSEAAARAQKKQFVFYQLMTGGHDAMITKPKELADILLKDKAKM
jgi:pimeloyl-ACP methyl ester carboxylesterase